MFTLDSRLQADTLKVGDLALCRVLLMNDTQYPWCILVPKRPDITEVFDLTAEEQQQLWQESSLLASTMQRLFNADKMNIATLGNVVSQLHIHVISRQTSDSAWPAPVWGKHPAIPYTSQQAQTVIQQLTDALEGHWHA